VSFVDSEEGEFGLGETGTEFFIGETFGSDIEELKLTCFKAAVERDGFIGAEGGVEPSGGDAFADEGVDLVFHQCDER